MNTVQRQRPSCSQARMGCGSPLTLLRIGVVDGNMFTGLTGRDEKLNVVRFRQGCKLFARSHQTMAVSKTALLMLQEEM